MPIQFKHIRPIYVPALLINLFITGCFSMSVLAMATSYFTFGFLASMFVTELFVKKYVYLFRNLGYSRFKLWAYCWIFNLAPGILILFIRSLWKS